ncbi:MAG: MATE family efflux transporter [Wujia sp.]
MSQQLAKEKKKYEMDMCNGPILPKLLAFTLPIVCSSILQLLFNAADIIVVGKYAGDNALAAVGSNTALINLLTNFFLGLSIGANVLVARFYGAKAEKDVSDTVHTAMTLSIISGVILTIIGCFGARQILIWMRTPEDVLPLATTYLRIYFLGMTAMMIYNFGSAVLRAVGDTKRPLYFLMLAGVINVGLNLLFVIRFRMSVAGVGLATVISQCISAGLILTCMMREKGCIRLRLRGLRVHKKRFFEILRVGLPASFQGIIFAISNVIIQSSVNSFGSTVVAGNSAASNIEGFVYVAMYAFHQGNISFTSQNVGAGRYERINRILLVAEGCVIVTGVLLGNLAVLFGDELLGFYTANEAVKAAGMVRLNIICKVYALCGIMDVLVGSLRGLGYSLLPTIVSLIGACGLRLLWIFTFFRMYDTFHTTKSLYLTYPVSWIITSLAHIVCFVIVRRKFSKNASIA